MIGWYVIQSKFRKENFLCTQCQQRSIETYLPLLPIPLGNGTVRQTPYFPGYLFIHVDLQSMGISALKWMPGALGFVSFDGEPASIPNTMMQSLRQKIDQAVMDKPTAPRDQFHAGDAVLITSGPFEGYEAIFDTHLDGKKRARVMLQFFQNRQTQVDLSSSAIRLMTP